MDRTSRAPKDCLDVHLPVSSPSIPSSTSSFLCVSDCPSSASVRLLDQAARMLQQFPSSLYICILELLPFSSFSLTRSNLNVPNANLIACSIVVSFHFVSFSSSIIIGSGYGQCTCNVHFSPPVYRCIASNCRPPTSGRTNENRGKKKRI